MSQLSGMPELSGIDEYQRVVSLLDERRFEEAQVRGRVLLESGDIGLLVRAKAHNLLCWTFIEGRKRPSPEAVLHGEEAARLADRVGDRPLQAQALANLASAQYQVGDYAASRRTYRELIMRLSVQPDLLLWGLVLAHQGLAQLDVVEGRPQDALIHLDHALTLCRDEESRFLLADIHRRRAIACLKLGDSEAAAAALGAIDEAACAAGPRGLWWRTHLAFTRARLEVARERWSAARSQVVTALQLARELADQPVIAECTCLLALVEAAEGRKEASRRARAALTYAIHSGRRDVVDEVRQRLREFLDREG